jgi:hypothetical protein
MLSGETKLEPPAVNWMQVFEEGRPFTGHDPHDPVFVEKCRDYTAPFIGSAKSDPEFQEFFSGITPEVAASILCSPRVAGSFLYFAKRQNPFVLDGLVQNQAACIVTANHAILGLEPDTSKPDPTDQQFASFGKSLLLDRALDDNARWPVEVTHRIASHSMAELLHAIGSDWAVIEQDNTVDLVDDLLDDPVMASKLCQAILEDQQPLTGTSYQAYALGEGGLRLMPPFHHLANRKELQKKLLSSPRFKDPAFRLLDTLVGRDYVGPAVYKSVSQRLEAGQSETTIAAELRERINHIGRAAVKPGFLAEQASYDEAQNDLLRSVLRWSQFNFGGGELASLLTTIDELRELSAGSLCSRYQPSGFLEINRATRAEKSLTEDMVSRLKQLYAAHFDGYSNTQWGESYFGTIDARLNDLAANVSKQYNAADEANRQKIAFQLDQLEQARDYDYREFPRGIAILARYKQYIQPELTAMLLANVPFDSNEYHAAIKLGESEAVAAIVENILHNGVSNLLEKPGLSKQDKRAIKDLLSVRALEPMLEQHKSDQPPVKLNFVPVRGMLLEASGYIGKACWAEKGIISRDRDNIDGLVFVEQTGSDEELVDNFAGASILIRATANDGQPLLIIRGLNPADSLLNKVELADFYSKLTRYVQDLAESDGRQAAIVIGDLVGRATTNRPILFNFLSRRLTNQNHSGLQKIRVPLEETVFNGYDITDDTYLLPKTDS